MRRFEGTYMKGRMMEASWEGPIREVSLSTGGGLYSTRFLGEKENED